MRFVDEYRDPELLRRQLAEIRRICSRRWVIMDVCGGQTHSLMRHGLEDELSDILELVHGPGCPVCVTPAETIEDASQLARRRNLIIATFGDMLRVPGRRGSLLRARTEGADVRIVYSPIDALKIARQNRDRAVVFFGVGFETTAPATALAILQARQSGLKNFFVLAHHVRVEPAMRLIMTLPDNRVQAFLAAGHVCTVTGFGHYERLVQDHRIPVVVTGFEPMDLLAGLSECVRLLEGGQPALTNQYARSVRVEGNLRARNLIETVFDIATVPWRGFGSISSGGYVIKPEFRDFDARDHFQLTSHSITSDGDCLSAEIMAGRIKPPQCPLFGNACTPDGPQGAPMVSSEGACAAYHQYARTSGN